MMKPPRQPFRRSLRRGLSLRYPTAVAVTLTSSLWPNRRQSYPPVVVSTASPSKFADSVPSAVSNLDHSGMSEFEKVEELARETKTEIPAPIAGFGTALASAPNQQSELNSALVSRGSSTFSNSLIRRDPNWKQTHRVSKFIRAGSGHHNSWGGFCRRFLAATYCW